MLVDSSPDRQVSAAWSLCLTAVFRRHLASGWYGPSMAQIILPSENRLEIPAEGVGSASNRPRTPGSGEWPGDDIPCPPVQEILSVCAVVPC
eukprot:scaffold74124_cov37-Phaeocystis_antarctica.AAC.1